MLVDGPERAARSMLCAVGFTEADFKKSLIGIASMGHGHAGKLHID